MPLTVITLKNSPPSLRGDLTKWMQEITTGVYVGNFNSRVREKLWERVVESVGTGEATMSYAYQNEIGYDFETHNAMRENIDFDGIPLVLNIEKNLKSVKIKDGFSNAAKFRKSKKFTVVKRTFKKEYVVVDIETDGLDFKSNDIIEIGAIKVIDDSITLFSRLIKIEKNLPNEIIKLTGIDDNVLTREGIPIDKAIKDFLEFIGDSPIIGYNIKFDLNFLNEELLKMDIPKLTNKSYDAMTYVKRDKMFLQNYKLETVLKAYDISEELPHRALEDAKLINKLVKKVNGFLEKIK